MKYTILIIIILFSLLLNAFFVQEKSNYEYLLFYKLLKGEYSLYNFPLFLKNIKIDSSSIYEKYLNNYIEWEKSNNLNSKITLSVKSESYYDSNFTEKISINALGNIKLNNNMFISVSAFVENDSISEIGVNTHTQHFLNQDIIGGFDNGYIMYKTDKYLFAFGRIDYHKSLDPYTSLIYDYNAPPLDGIYISVRLFDNAYYDFKYASLGYTQVDSQITTYTVLEQYDIVSRFLAFHSINYIINKDLLLSFSESVVFGREHFTGFDYLFPFFIYYGEQENMNINDNILWNLSINYNFSNMFNSSISLLIDDYQYEKEDIYDYEPPMLGYMIKIFMHNDYGYFGIIHHFVNAWVYNQVNNWNKYEYNNHLLGYENAPDIRDIQFVSNIAINENTGVDFNMGYYIKGNNTINSNWVFPLDSTNMYYYENAYGIEPVEHYFSIENSIKYKYKKCMLQLSGFYKYSKENNNIYNIKFLIKTIL